MNKSNIIGGSNVYYCTGEPSRDQHFVDELENYRLLKSIHNMIINGQTSVHLSKKQRAIVDVGIRCAYLKQRPDPCWGYIKGQGIRGRCIEGRCLHIMTCNPTFTEEQASFWAMSEETKQLYGNPDKQKKYYLVDLVSDIERQKYPYNSGNGSLKYKSTEDKAEKTESQKQFGRQKVIIGFEETYFGDADNQLSPIWGYVDDAEGGGPIIKKHYGSHKESVHARAHKTPANDQTKRNDKQTLTTDKSKSSVAKSISERSRSYDELSDIIQKVKQKINESVQLTGMTKEWIFEFAPFEAITVVLANEAEVAYVSGMFSKLGIDYDIDNISKDCSVFLWNAENVKKLQTKKVLISSGLVQKSINLKSFAVWTALEKATCLVELKLEGRDFYEFETEFGNRWGCRNLYGTTHIALRLNDFHLAQEVHEDHKVSLVRDGDNYLIIDSSEAECLGKTNNSFSAILKKLKKEGDIPEYPRLITGVVISTTGKQMFIKGIGHMRFDEY